MVTPEELQLRLPRRHTSRIPRSRREAYKSFENLVVLADDQERWKFARKVGKQLVWRDVGEPPVLLERFRECAEHAGIGGLRAGALAYAARSGVNLFILCFELARTPKKLRFSLIRHAIFSKHSLHFGAMIGTFVGIYKFILNALPIFGLRFKVASERKVHLSQWDALDIRVDSDRPEPGRRSPPSPWGASDGENGGGLYMGSKKPAKSCLKDSGSGPTTPFREDFSSPFSPDEDLEEPPAMLLSDTAASESPSRSPTPEVKLSMKERTARHAHFPTEFVVDASPRFRSKELDSETYQHAITHPGHLSASTQAAFALMREKGYTYKRWHAAVAGSVAGAAAIMVEQKSNRLSVAQQMFVRGLQGTFNLWSDKTGITIPFGSVWVFALCCGQIMYGFMLRPDTIPPSYANWMQKASFVPQECITITRNIMMGGFLDVNAQKRLADGNAKPWNSGNSIVTPYNRKYLLDEIAKAESGQGFAPFVSCSAMHPHADSCVAAGTSRFFEVTRWIGPLYGALHFIPMLAFRRKVFANAPLRMSIKALLGSIRSASFLGVYVAIYQIWICFLHFVYGLPITGRLGETLRKLAASKPLWWMGGFLSGLSLLVEDPRRREELAMYVLPKGLESGWKVIRGQLFGVPARRKGGWKSDFALCAAGMGMVMSTYQHSPQHLSGLVRRVLYQLVGPN